MTARLLAIGLVLALGVVYLSCGGDEDGGQPATATPVSSATLGPVVDKFVIYRDTLGDILALDVQTAEKYRKPTDPANEAFLTAECSRDGKRIAYLHQDFREVTRQVIIGGEDPPEQPVSVPAQTQGISWSPDGSRLVYADYTVDVGYRVATIDLATGEEEEVVRGVNFAGSPRWSPDGHYIAFHAQVGLQTQVMLYELGAGEERPTQLTDGLLGTFDPEWLDDSRTLIVSSANEGEQVLQLFTLDIETKEMAAITESNIYKRFPRLSPDGEMIGYTGSIVVPTVSAGVSTSALHSFGIFLLNRDGTNERALTADPRLNPGPQDPYLDAFLLGWCTRGPWLDDTWTKEEEPSG